MFYDIPVSAYYAHALSLKPEERLCIAEFSRWLPEEIIDSHAHCNLPEHVTGISIQARGHMLSTFPYLSLQDSRHLQSLFYPGIRVRKLRFPKTFSGIDHRTANRYLLEESPIEDRIAVFGLQDDVEYTVAVMRHPRCTALKMYYSYLEPPAETIYEVFPREVLEEAQALQLPIILHLPKVIIHTVEDLRHVLADFPRLRISLAHLGLSKMLVPGLAEAYECIAFHENLNLDTALNPSADVVKLALDTFGSNRIMFGSDEPLNLIRSIPFMHPQRGQRITADYPYHWMDRKEYAAYGHLANVAIHAHWSSLAAVRGAIERYHSCMQESLVRKIFYSNAAAFFGF